MVFNFSNFLFKLLPQYFKEEDSYKNGSDEGLLERFLQTPDDMLNDTRDKVENLVRDVIDIANCDPKFLNHIAYTLGNPPDIMNDEGLYRKLLHYVTSLYKIKGTIPSYRYFFNLLGFSISITETDCIDTLYDTGILYDDGNFYDKYCCGCSLYDISFSSNTGSTTLSQTVLDNLYKVIFFLEPINAKLGHISNLVQFREQAGYCYLENVVIEVRQYVQYDSGITYDDGSIYDDYSVTQSASSASNSCDPNPITGPFLLQKLGPFITQKVDGTSKIIIDY